jgi:hypothetical protein
MLIALADAIAKKPCLREGIVLQGGTTLHLAYQSPRYTADLDFVWARKLPDKGTMIQEMVAMEVGPVEGRILVSSLKKDDGRLVRIAFSLPMEPGFAPTVNLEGFDAPPIFGSRLYKTPYGPVEVETPLELLVDKVVAALARPAEQQRIKAGDIFDLFYILSNFEDKLPDIMAISAKAASYRLDYSNPTELAGLIRRTIERIRNEEPAIESALRIQLEPNYARSFLFRKMFDLVIGKLEGLAASLSP